MRRKAVIKIMVMLLALMFAGCATFSGEDISPERRYLSALKWFNDNQTTYLDAFDRATPATQAEWRASIHPRFELADQFLEAWGKTIQNFYDEAMWREIQADIIRLLLQYGVKEG